MPVYKPVTFNSTVRDIMRIPAGAAVLTDLLNAIAPPGPEDGEDSALGVSMMDLLGDSPIRAMCGFSGGRFTEEQAQQLLDAINAQPQK